MAQELDLSRPYADFIEDNYGATQSLLVDYLRRGYNVRNWVERDPSIDIYILDSVQGSLREQHFCPNSSAEVDGQFRLALNTRPDNSRTRIVLVQGGQLADTNAAYLDAIGSHFQLHPSFFCAYLQVAFYLPERERMFGARQFPVSFPSENDYIMITTDTVNSFAIASIDRRDDRNTIVMLGIDHFGNRIRDLRDHIFTFPQNLFEAADTHPCDYLLFYIQESLRAAAVSSRRNGFLQPVSDWPSQPKTSQWEWNQAGYRNLLQSQGTILRYIQRNYPRQGPSRPVLASTLQDYEFLIAETRENATQLQCLLQNYTSIQAIKESKKALEQADAVRRITIVGMVFIPLSFATSFFGMNLEQLGNGTLHIGFFVLLAVITGFVTWALAASIGPVEQMWERAQNQYGQREFGAVDTYDWISRRVIIWDWMYRNLSLINALQDLWVAAQEHLMDETGEFEQEQIPPSRQRVARRLLNVLFQRGKERLKMLFSRNPRSIP